MLNILHPWRSSIPLHLARILSLPLPTGSSSLVFPVIDSAFPLNKGWIHLNASTYEVENLLNTEYHVYTHPSGDTQIGEKFS